MIVFRTDSTPPIINFSLDNVNFVGNCTNQLVILGKTILSFVGYIESCKLLADKLLADKLLADKLLAGKLVVGTHTLTLNGDSALMIGNPNETEYRSFGQ